MHQTNNKSVAMPAKSFVQNLVAMADPAIVKELCAGLRQMRLNKNFSQDQLARKAGLNRATIIRMEAGRAATLLTIVQVLRALDMLEILNAFREEPQISPIQLLRIQQRQRKRASAPRSNRGTA